MSAAVDAVSKVFSAVFKPISKLLAPGVDNAKAPSDTGNTKQTIRSGKEPAHFIYGRTATGGLLFWAQEEPGDQDEHEKLVLGYLLAEGDIDGIEQVYVNQEPVNEFGYLVEWQLYRPRTTPPDYMLENCPDWKREQIGRGVSWVRVTLTFDKEKFATGIPDLLFVVRGNRNIYDPRTGETGYSDNGVLCLLDYVRNRLGVADRFIVWDAWVAAANVAGETVSDPDGTRRPRYAIGGVYKANQRKDETLASLEENVGGAIRRIGGLWGVEVGAYYGPAVAALTEDMVIGSVTGRTEVKRSDAINSVAGKWNSPADLWEETSYPTVTVDEWVVEDGGENTDTFDTPFSPSAHQSQRLANIKLRRQRAGAQLEIPLNHAGYQFRPGRIINVELPTINVSGEFKVLEWRFGAKKGSTIVVRQEDPGFYDDNVGEPFDYLSIIRTPTGGIGSPRNLRYTVETVGDVVQGRLTWDPVNAAIDYNVVIYRDTEVVQAIKTPSGATTCVLSGLSAGEYSASVTARGLQSTSGPATIVFSILTPPQPARVITQVDRTNVMLIPVLADGDALGGGTFEYRWSTTDTLADAEYIGRGDTITHTGRSPGQILYYWIRGVNAYGVSDWFAAQAQTNESFDDVFSAIRDDIESEGTLFPVLVDSVSPGVINQVSGEITREAESAVAPFRDELNAATESIGELEAADEEKAIKLLLLKAGGEASASTLRVEQIVRSDLAQQVTTLEIGQSSLTQRLTVSENENGSQANLIQQLRTAQADVRDELYTMWDPGSQSFTSAALRVVNVGGRRAVLGMRSNGQVAEIGAVADRFYIYNEVSGEMVLAFVVEDGRVVMPEALIGRVNVQKLVTDTGETLIEGGKIKTKFLRVDEIRVNELISSVTASNGRPTYALRPGGNFELNSPDGGMQWINNTQTVRDEQGRVRVRIGRL